MISGFGNRFSPIDPSTVGMISLVEIPDKEALIRGRMALIKELWAKYDPPFAAQYDVEELEFDPLKITAEAGISSVVNGLSLINSMGKVTSLLYAYGEDLDVVASRYPGGIPRIDKGLPTQELDERYRYRIWLSSNAFSTAGADLAYIFHALTAVPELRDVTVQVERASLDQGPVIVVSCLAERVWFWKGDTYYQSQSPGESAKLLSDSAQPTDAQLLRVRTRLTRRDIGPPTDVMSIRGPIETPVALQVGVYAYPGNDGEAVRASAEAQLHKMADERRFLGIDVTRLAIDDALGNVTGLQDRVITSPTSESTPIDNTGVATFTIAPVVFLGFQS